MSRQAALKTKIQQSIALLIHLKQVMHQQVAMHQAVSAQHHQQHQQQINAAVPPPNAQNVSNGVSLSIQEHARYIMAIHDIE
eukprot:15359914-Ditylum_brightwellii.AAC.1